MASKLLGRIDCPWCGFKGAHVKESEKCLYVFCPECRINGPHFKTEQQRAALLGKMRPEGAPVAPPSPTPTPTPTPPTGGEGEGDRVGGGEPLGESLRGEPPPTPNPPPPAKPKPAFNPWGGIFG